MVCFMGYLSEAGDEPSPAQRFQDAFMLLKRAKRQLTSAFPDTAKATAPKQGADLTYKSWHQLKAP